MSVVIEGDGVAAVCVAQLLSDSDLSWIQEGEPRPKLASILLSEQTQHLFLSLFPQVAEKLSRYPRIRQRMVLWGDAREPLLLPHRGIVVPEAQFLQDLWGEVRKTSSAHRAKEKAWRIRVSKVQGAADQSTDFGKHHAVFCRVKLAADVEAEACWVESLPAGWMFLLSTGDGEGTLIATGAAPQALLAESRLIAKRIREVGSCSSQIPAYPRKSHVLAAEGYLACGTAAMSFDPLCGEGAGNAIREAFLAAAVVRAGNRISPERLQSHYASRLTQGMLRHLEVCHRFYSTGGEGTFWKIQSQTLQESISTMRQNMQHFPTSDLRLLDRDLLDI